MLYFSSILDKSVRNEEGRRIGRVGDMLTPQNETFPRITDISMRAGRKFYRIPWEKVKHVDHDGVIVKGKTGDFRELTGSQGNFFLKRDVLDKQIVDINGQRVVRVNDVQLNMVGRELRVAGVDIGTQGLLRRLGFLGIAKTFAELFNFKATSNIIPWDAVQTIGSDPTSPIRLSTTHRNISTLHPADLADILEDLSGTERRKLFETLDTETAAETLEHLEEEAQLTLFASLPDEKAADLLEEMSPDDAADLLQDLPDERAEALLSLMDAEDALEVKELLVYEEDTAGGIMSNEFLQAPPTRTVAETIEMIRNLSTGAELVYYIYITGEREKLLGVVSLRDLIVASPTDVLKDIMESVIVAVPTNADVKKIATITAKYDLFAVPVVDEKMIIKGIVTVDDVMDYLLED
ncbi:MAG: CBS domain-containing protein [Firmicutes bacterium]|nr:CBS domain-containing protein [Bacillota bacterium]